MSITSDPVSAPPLLTNIPTITLEHTDVKGWYQEVTTSRKKFLLLFK
jgi:hypothetical protein